ncbi:MAG: hypothetical protein ABIA93_00700 [Candidatus Woesearchaeota archaeon]
MDKMENFLEGLDTQEIQRLIDDHEQGQLGKRLKSKLAERSYEQKTCPVCHSAVQEGTLTLIFGPKEFRRKATFCAYDCLLYFAQNLNIKTEPI